MMAYSERGFSVVVFVTFSSSTFSLIGGFYFPFYAKLEYDPCVVLLLLVCFFFYFYTHLRLYQRPRVQEEKRKKEGRSKKIFHRQKSVLWC